MQENRSIPAHAFSEGVGPQMFCTRQRFVPAIDLQSPVRSALAVEHVAGLCVVPRRIRMAGQLRTAPIAQSLRWPITSDRRCPTICLPRYDKNRKGTVTHIGIHEASIARSAPVAEPIPADRSQCGCMHTYGSTQDLLDGLDDRSSIMTGRGAAFNHRNGKRSPAVHHDVFTYLHCPNASNRLLRSNFRIAFALRTCPEQARALRQAPSPRHVMLTSLFVPLSNM
ncbi:uncharacterized protein C8Q71DRAFT_768740 [Rhodofomes roseus]|uniref:Uncharacterized protein n=1 Tax=Rhodofomes roseus TaxID=34475 RepID=A0ABQ8KB98_9APHY|nr:uncharacterized protein C8Q71DRAFT_768740 [Rhodofomes roseus]KAH9834429.1 hypothetical protein C8Q71DRAFT_768740 [Rhodofomes roseus]